MSDKKYIAYYRKSTDTEDKQVLSLEGQKEVVKDFADRNSITIIAEFEESYTAKKPGRPVFNQVVAMLESKNYDGIVSYKADRLTRNYVDLGVIMTLLESGVEIWDCLFGHYTNDANGKMMLGLNTVMAKRKIDDLSEDTKRGMKQKVEMGWFPGWAPTGYINDKLEKTIRIDQKTVPYIKRAFDLMASGKHSLSDIVTTINNEGYISRVGRKTERSSLHVVLTNPFYYGFFRWNGNLHKGKHKPLIDKETFDKAQAALNSRNTLPIRMSRIDFKYRGLLKCFECGCTITAERHTKKMDNGNIHKYTYYRCTKAKGKCSQPYITEEELEVQLSEVFKPIKIKKQTAEQVIDKLGELYENDKSYQEKVERNLERKLVSLGEEKKKLYRKMVNDKMADTMFEELKKDVEEEITSVEKKLKDIASHSKNWLDQSSELIKLCHTAHKLFLSGNIDQKKALLRSVSSELYLKDGKVDVTYKNPFDVIAKAGSRTDWLPRLDSNQQPLA
ncbi:recombinase family protein [Patescibacteria group bacterium]